MSKETPDAAHRAETAARRAPRQPSAVADCVDGGVTVDGATPTCSTGPLARLSWVLGELADILRHRG